LFTPVERRGALIVALLFGLGALGDLWRAAHPRLTPAPRAWESGAFAGRGASPREAPADSAAPVVAAGSAAAAAPIDLNRAGAAELDRLPGIGPVLARRIVEHRTLHGGFRNVEELLLVRGIGPKLFARLEPRVTVGPPGGASSRHGRIVRGDAATP
jgi:competence ComEA-like helix-hairpin-helix protein